MNRTRATLIARSLITEWDRVEKFPALGSETGQSEVYPNFRWEREVNETDLPEIREVHLRVIWDEERPNAFEMLYYALDNREPEQQ